eukprot:932897-Rhodomonas_salina.1
MNPAPATPSTTMKKLAPPSLASLRLCASCQRQPGGYVPGQAGCTRSASGVCVGGTPWQGRGVHHGIGGVHR